MRRTKSEINLICNTCWKSMICIHRLKAWRNIPEFISRLVRLCWFKDEESHVCSPCRSFQYNKRTPCDWVTRLLCHIIWESSTDGTQTINKASDFLANTVKWLPTYYDQRPISISSYLNPRVIVIPQSISAYRHHLC